MNDEKPPLFAECGRCGGQGYWTPPPEVRGSSRTIFGRGDCPDCGGLGVILSRQGAEGRRTDHATSFEGPALKPASARQSASSASIKPPLVFISYSHRDEDARITLDKHMAQLKREGVEIWFDGDMLPGEELDPEIRRMLKRADVFVALASPDYLHSAYCYETEYGYAIRKAARKQVHVVVALLRACQWRHTRMARYKLLPKDGKPVDQWARRGDAYEDIVEGIRAVVKVVRRDSAAPSSLAPGKRKRSPLKAVPKASTVRRAPAAAKTLVSARATNAKGSSVEPAGLPRKRPATAAKRKPARPSRPGQS